MRSIVFFIALLAPVGAFTVAPSVRTIKPELVGGVNVVSKLSFGAAGFREFKSERAVTNFECGVCGGVSEWCPACRAPTALCDDKSEPEAKGFECGVCGGAGIGCPACQSPL